MGKKRDRTKEYHFKLVNRSMADPNHDMPDMGQHVLVPYVPTNMRKKGMVELEAPGKKLGLDDTVFGIHDNLADDEKEQYERRIYGLRDEDVDEVLPAAADGAALDKDCYFPVDGYDYEKHLRAVGKTPPMAGAQLGSAPPGFSDDAPVDDTYLYGKSRDRMTRDELQLQDALDADAEYEEADADFFEELMEDAVGEADVLRPCLWGGDTSEHVPIEADEDFDAVLDEYDDELLGAMETLPEGLEGGDRIEDFENVLDEYIDKPLRVKAKTARDLDAHLREVDDVDSSDEEVDEELRKEDDEEAAAAFRAGHGARTLAMVQDDEECGDEELAKQFDRVTVKEDLFDCESVLSLRSNTSNHPGRIVRPDKDKRKPKALAAVGEEDEAVEELVEMPEVQTLRPKDETAEEKKARKAAVKEHQRIARTMKKDTKELYKQERSKISARVKVGGDLREGIKHFAL